MSETKSQVTCVLCGHSFVPDDHPKNCGRCRLLGLGGCRAAHCPRCGYPMPAPPRLPGLLANLKSKILPKP